MDIIRETINKFDTNIDHSKFKTMSLNSHENT